MKMITFEQQQIKDFADALGNRLSRKEKNIIKRPYGNENYSYFWKNIASDLIIEFFNKYKVKIKG